MIVDTSALIAVLYQEPDAARFERTLTRADICRMSAGNLVELSIVIEGQFGAALMRQAEALLRDLKVRIEPVTEEQARIAHQAFCDFGKGRHPAGLNFGDCFAYALARTLREPLLFKGDDFSKTDVECAV